MSDSVIMPQLGETVAEGKILTWFKSIGDEIKKGDNLFEVETDKVTVEVQSIVEGRLTEIRVGPGAVAKVGEIVAMVGGESAAAAPVRIEAQEAAEPTDRRSPFEEVTTPAVNFGPARGPDGVRVSPLARRLIAQNGLDLAKLASDVKQRGGAKVGEPDVRAALASQPAKRVAGTVAGFASTVALSSQTRERQVIALNPVRLKTAERLAENWRTIPHVFQAIEVDFTQVDRARRKYKEAFQQARGFPLTYLPFIARATCLALRAFPHVNAQFDGKSLNILPDVHLGVAVDLSHNGLVVPVVHDAADLTLAGLAEAMRRQIDKARAGKLSPDDLSGATYSISNNGAFGTTFTAPIINAPQVAILSTDAIRLRPAVVSTAEGDFVAPRPMGMIGQSFDHRAFDGAYSAAYLSRLKQILEDRNWGDELGENA
jgi:pyruvate/2-oxoglutarate dehydrogenase complex dihydrolipoamide acyltransferase (E2) component